MHRVARASRLRPEGSQGVWVEVSPTHDATPLNGQSADERGRNDCRISKATARCANSHVLGSRSNHGVETVDAERKQRDLTRREQMLAEMVSCRGRDDCGRTPMRFEGSVNQCLEAPGREEVSLGVTRRSRLGEHQPREKRPGPVLERGHPPAVARFADRDEGCARV